MNGEVMLPCSTFVARRYGPDVSGTRRSLRIDGAVAEWLGRGLQNLLQRFESAQRLKASHAEEFCMAFLFPSRVNLGSERVK